MGGAGLILEITERDGIGNDPASMDAMTTLADRGVPFAIDDFGVGFSSIGYLQDMPVQIIKTDLSFSESIDRDERSCALLCSITMMGQALGLDVVVEGIERASQLDHLREHVHAPFAQGYLMHRPMPLDQLVEVLAENRCRSPTGARRPAPSGRPPPSVPAASVDRQAASERHPLHLLEGVRALARAAASSARSTRSSRSGPGRPPARPPRLWRYGAVVASVIVPT